MDAKNVCIVAEMSANHNQDYKCAEGIVRAAKEAGADAVKVQTYTPDTMTIESNKPEFRISGGTPWDGDTLYELYKRAYMPWDWQAKLKQLADEIGIELFPTVYDRTAVDFWERIGVTRYKVASFEVVDLDLIKYVAGTKKPLVLSTGMAGLEEIKEAVKMATQNGTTDVTLLRCVSAYPAPPLEMNLHSIPYLRWQFPLLRGVKLLVGLSDHTLGSTVAIAAVALGASMVEKHFTLSRDYLSPDSSFSMEPYEFKEMAEGIRTVEQALGERIIGVTEVEKKSLVFRRSLFVVEDMKQGEIFTRSNVRSIRPGYGILPKHLADVEGKRASRDIERGTPLQWECIAC